MRLTPKYSKENDDTSNTLKAHRSPWITHSELPVLVAVLALSLGVWFWIAQWSEEHLLIEQNGHIKESLSSHGRKLEIGIHEQVALLEGLGAYAASSIGREDWISDFEMFASGLHTGDSSILALQIYPSSGKVLVFPKNGNEAILNRTMEDLVNDERPQVRSDVQQALKTRKISTSGPYTLLQGVYGFVLRKAVYSNDKLQAIVTVVIDLPIFLENCGIVEELTDLSLALYDDRQSIILGGITSQDNPFIYTVSWPDREWSLAAIPSQRWSAEVQDHVKIIKRVGGVVVLVITGLTYLISSRRWRAELLVKNRTTSLKKILRQYEKTVTRLETSERQYSQLFNISPDPLFLLDSTGGFLDCNDRATQQYGFTKEEILSMSARDLAPALMKDKVPEQLRLATSKNVTFEWRHRRKDGSVFPVDIKAQPFDISGKPHILASVRDISLQVAAREAITESEEKFRSIFEAANVGKSITSLTGEISVNSAFAEMLGYRKEDLATKTWQELTPSEEIPALEETRDRMLSGEVSSTRIIKRFIHKDGSHVWCDVSSTLKCDKEGKPQYFITTILDITERRKAEQDLRHSERRFYNAFHTSPAGMIITRIKDGKVINVNDSFLQLFEFTKEDVVGHTSIELGMWSREERERIIQKQLETGGLRNFELEAKSKTGRVKYILFSSNPIDIAEEPHHITTIVDISERKKAETELYESERKYRALFENMTAGFVLFEVVANQQGEPVDLIVLKGNPGFEKTTGIKIENSEGKRLTELLPGIENDEANWIGTYGEIALKGGTRQFERGSELLGYFYSVIAYQAGTGQCAVTFVDISDRKKAEIDLQKLNMELEERVENRTAQLNEVNRELEAFTYSVSHDLRAPLRSVDGYTQILVDDYNDRLDDEGRRICSIVQKSARNMGKLIDDLLQLSRTGRADMQISAIDMKAVANNVYAELIETAGRYKADFLISNLPMAHGDPALVRLVWTNLLSNALKYSSKLDKPVIEVFSEIQNGQNVYAVRDNGVGFEMQYADKLFSAFHRLHSAMDYEGTGVGLAIVHRVITRHGGRVWATSQKQKGATFYFTLGEEVVSQ